jgi:hypothetical protein
VGSNPTLGILFCEVRWLPRGEVATADLLQVVQQARDEAKTILQAGAAGVRDFLEEALRIARSGSQRRG